MPPLLQTGASKNAQASVQNRQAATQSGTGTTSIKAVQPGAASASINQSVGSGVPISGSSQTGISLNATAPNTSTTAQATVTTQPAHDFNPALIAIPIVLFLLGAVLVWVMHRSVKNTTQYK